MRVVFHYDTGPRMAERLHALAAEGLHVDICSEGDEARFAGLMQEAEVLWHALKPVTAPIIAAAPRLKLIQKIGVGINTIDVAAAVARGIRVCNMPGTNSPGVAEMTLLLMLAALRRLPLFDRRVRAGLGWVRSPELTDQLGELQGRTVGLVGFGAVSHILSACLPALGAKVIYTSRTPKPDAPIPFRPLDQLLATADIVSLHLPLTVETERMIDRAAFARMKPGAILVNTARGGLVDEAALVDALTSGKLGAAGLDVFAEEPPPANHPLFALDNVVLAPHAAWVTSETLERSIAVAAENCRRLAAGEPLLHQVA